MTEHVVLTRAAAYRAELEHRERMALQSLSAVRAEKADVEKFLEMWAHFEKQSPPETTPPAKTSTAEREGDDSSANGTPGRPVGDPADPLRSEAALRKDASLAAPGPSALDHVRSALLRQIADKPHKSAPKYNQEYSEPIPAARQTVKDRVAAAHAEHPDFSLTDLSKHLGSAPGPISKVVKQLGIKLPSAVRPPAPRKVDGIGSKVEAYLVDHPEATTSEIATALGVRASSVRVAELARGLKIRKLTPEERSAAQRAAYERSVEKGTAARSPQKFVRPEPARTAPAALAPVPAPTPAPDLETPLVPVPPSEDDGAEQPVFEVGDPDAEGEATEATPEPVLAPVYRLLSPSGQWLHRDMGRTTYKVSDAWQGSAQDMERVFKGNPRLKVYEAMKA